MSAYTEFLATKTRHVNDAGTDVTPDDINPWLHEWQREIVTWAVRRGRAAIWADTGLGKTAMQLEWIRLTTGDGIGLIVAPLAVCQQTIREARDHLGIAVEYVRAMPADPGIYITNYEMVQHFDADLIAAVVLDESSILKQSVGKTRTALIAHFKPVKYRLACTATPAPNDPEELTNHAEFLGVTTRTEMLAAYFVHDQDGWRLKGHARRPMFRWMASWAVALRRPSDMGYSDTGYILPELHIHSHLIDVNVVPEGQLFATDIGGVGGRAQVRKQTIEDRCRHAADLIAREPDEPWIAWCGLNAEADLMADLIPDAVNVHGAWSPEDKAQAMLDFADGNIRVLVTKPSIASFGLNWQHCARMVFVGLSDSYMDAGWIFHGEVTIDKDPQAQAIRTKAQALMFVTKNRDSSMTRPALADYLLLFRKPGDNPTPIKNDVSNEEWIDWARPVWLDIKETNTLNARVARESADERHICPLQLDFIERCVRLWSNPGETVFTPFAGIGSELYVAVQRGREAIGIELKPAYWRVAVRNLQALDETKSQVAMF